MQRLLWQGCHGGMHLGKRLTIPEGITFVAAANGCIFMLEWCQKGCLLRSHELRFKKKGI